MAGEPTALGAVGIGPSFLQHPAPKSDYVSRTFSIVFNGLQNQPSENPQRESLEIKNNNTLT